MSWLDRNWHYVPAAAHNDATAFRRRMQTRAKAKYESELNEILSLFD